MTAAIACLLVGLIWPFTAYHTTPARMHVLLAKMASILRDARTSAIATNSDVTAYFDASERLFHAGRASLYIPSDISVAVTSGGDCRSDGAVTEITFHPDGTNCGGVFHFASDGGAYRLRVNWATGYVDLLGG